MADGVTLPGDGSVVATDGIAGQQYQRMKLVHGSDGVNDGDISLANGFPVAIVNPLTAFGELLCAEPTPQVQVKFPYNINPSVVKSLTNHASSSVANSAGIATITCAGAAETFAQIRTLDVLRYGPGQGADFKGTAMFTTGVANSSQIVGPGDGDEGFFFGYNGTSFGILHRKFGELERRSIEITGGADAGGGSFTITMDGTAVTVTVGASATIAEIVTAIIAAADDFGNAGRGWDVHYDDNTTVQFIGFVAENATGVFSFADVDSGVTAGTFNQSTTVIAGVAPTETWVPQASWSDDAMDGTGKSLMTLDPTKLNVYQVQFQFLGGGEIQFHVENPTTGLFVVVHRISPANSGTASVLKNPTLHLAVIAKTEAGYSGGALAIKTASLAGFIQGKETDLGIRRSAKNTKTTTGTTPLIVLTVHNEIDFQGTRNKVHVYPDFLTIASEASKTVTFSIILNPTEVGGAVAFAPIDASSSVMKKDTGSTTVVGGSELASFKISGSNSRIIDLKPLALRLRPGDRWVFVATLSSGSDAPVEVGVSWLERI